MDRIESMYKDKCLDELTYGVACFVEVSAPWKVDKIFNSEQFTLIHIS